MKKSRLFYTIASIIIGLLIGSIILLVNHTNPIEAYKIIILGSVGKPKFLGWSIVRATPIIMTGISVAFAFRTGLFNIGAEGQFIFGGIVAALLGAFVDLPPVIHPIVCIAGGILAGAIWGGIVGLLKARFGINEVISSIMFNWVAFYLNNYLLGFEKIRKPATDYSYPVKDTARIELLRGWKYSDQGMNFLSGHKAIRGFLNAPVHWGIFFAIIVAICAWYVLKHTTLGYQLRAVGFNKDAAEYGGIDIKKNTMKAMIIAGAISGLAGACSMLGESGQMVLLGGQQGYGFDGMSVALIAANNPILCIPAGFLFAALNYGGTKLTILPNTYSEITKVVIGLIVYSIAMPNLLDIIQNFLFRNNKKTMKEASHE